MFLHVFAPQPHPKNGAKLEAVLGGVLGGFWEGLGASSGASWGCLGASWGPSWGYLKASWGYLASSGRLGASWGGLGGRLGASWRRPGRVLRCPGAAFIPTLARASCEAA